MPDDRPQDIGRRRRRDSRAMDRALLDRWHTTLREQLDSVIVDLGPRVSDQMTVDGAPDVKLLTPEKRKALVDLGVKIADALGSAIDPSPSPGVTPGRSVSRRLKL